MTPGACFGSRIKKKKKSRNEEREADLSQRGLSHCGGYSPGSVSRFREPALGTVTGNADRNKSVGPTLLSGLQ